MANKKAIEIILDVLLLGVCALEIVAGVQYLTVDNDITDALAGVIDVPYGLLQSDAGVFFAIAGFTALTCLITIFVPRLTNNSTFLYSIFTMTLLSFCCQAAAAVISSAYLTIIKEQQSLLPLGVQLPDYLTLLKKELTAVAVSSFVLAVPIMIALLHFRWEAWVATRVNVPQSSEGRGGKIGLIICSILLLVVAAAHQAFGATFMQLGKYLYDLTNVYILYKSSLPISSYLIITGGIVFIYIIVACMSLKSSQQSAMMSHLSWACCWIMVVLSCTAGVMAANLFYKARTLIIFLDISVSQLPSQAQNAYYCALADLLAAFVLGLPISLVMMYMQNVHRADVAGDKAISADTPRQTEMLKRNQMDPYSPTF